MTNYNYQTNESLLIEGELGLNASNQLVSRDGNGNEIVLTPDAGSTAISDLVKQYAADVMDLSGVRTLGAGFIYLNGTSYDSMGVGVTEFEEPGGMVYGLYGRTDGVSQQVYYSAAFDNTQAMQYTTVPYIPPFLNGSIWQAQCICGTDLEGFVLQLRDTTPGSVATPRYLHVRHNGSLLNSSGHVYIEITQCVNDYLNSVTHSRGAVPHVIRVGNYFILALADWEFGSLWTGMWNDASSTYTNAALPSSAPSYTPQKISITTNGLPGADYTTGTTFPTLFGSETPGGTNGWWRVYNTNTGTTTMPSYNNTPEPIVSGWSANMASLLEGEVDGSGNVFFALGTNCGVGDAQGNGGFALAVLSIAVQMTGGSSGAYTSAQFNVFNANSPGADLRYMQPSAPFLITADNNFSKPQENVASNSAIPTTCIGKLPIATYYTGQYSWGAQAPMFFWYYSGVTAISAFGSNSTVHRGVTRPAGAQFGSLAAARANKLAMIYPMFNVNQRADFSSSTGASIVTSFVQPSGQLISTYTGSVVGPDMLLTNGLSANISNIWTISKYPANSNITDATYNRNGVAIPGFRTRVAEYLVNLPNPLTTLSTFGCIWPDGLADPKSPLNFIFPALSANNARPDNLMNNAQCRVGRYTPNADGKTYDPPPVL